MKVLRKKRLVWSLVAVAICLGSGVLRAAGPVVWSFGTAAGGVGDGGFVLVNTAPEAGDWSVEAESLRFSARPVADGEGGGPFTEVAAVIDLAARGHRPGQGFTVSAVLNLRGIWEWNRLGVIALAPDLSNHAYRQGSFYHGQVRVHRDGAHHLRIASDFGGDRPLASVAMPGTLEDGAYRVSLAGRYGDTGALALLAVIENLDTKQRWLSETEPITDPLGGTWFGIGGRLRAYPGSRRPVVDIRTVSFEAGVEALPPTDGDPIVHQGRWSQAGREVPCRVSVRRAAHAYRPLPAAVYLRHLGIPRIGTDPDPAIVEALLADGLVVIELDCRHLPQEYPALQHALMAINSGLSERVSQLTSGAIVPDAGVLYWLPEGYRLARGVRFWNIERHGTAGTLEHIVRTFNIDVVKRAGVAPIAAPEQLHGRRGEPLDYWLTMDILYPSGQPRQPVPVVAHFSTQCVLPRAFSEQRAIYPITWVTSGYALAYVDHVYNPLARTRYYGHFNAYSLQNWNGLAAGSAAIRFLRSQAGVYGLADRIGALGHSKSSYTVVRLADPRHPEQGEFSVFSGFPPASPEPQPWAGHASAIQVAYASMGDGTRRTRLFSRHMVPLFTAAGQYDQYDEWRRFPALVSACEQDDLQHHALWMEDLGHTYPMGRDPASGRDRTDMVKSFFDQHLHPRGEPDPLQVLAIIPAEDSDAVDLTGRSRFIMVPDTDLPPDMHGLAAECPITVVFARRLDPETVTGETLELRSADAGARVPGVWRPSLQDSRFQFQPQEPLRPGTAYEVVVNPGLRDRLGTALAAPVRQRFRTREP